MAHPVSHIWGLVHGVIIMSTLCLIIPYSQWMVALQSVSLLLFTVFKNHFSVAASCPGPVITALNSIQRTFIKLNLADICGAVPLHYRLTYSFLP